MTAGKTKPSAWNTAALYGFIATGSVLGGVARYLLSLLIQLIPGFPWATLFVNVTGSFIIGFYSTLSGPDGRLFASARPRQVGVTGFFGGAPTLFHFFHENIHHFAMGHGG